MLTGIIKFVVVDANIVSTFAEWTCPDYYRLLQNSNQQEKGDKETNYGVFWGILWLKQDMSSKSLKAGLYDGDEDDDNAFKVHAPNIM
jgi:hypothetical protein